MRRAALALVLLSWAAACGGDEPVPVDGPSGDLQLTSPAFAEGDTVPTIYTCDGENVSPPLRWSGVPDGTTELVLLLSDPDAPSGAFIHWSVTGIDPASTGVDEGEIPAGGAELPNSLGGTGYGGPCPPEGDEPHRYIFSLTAMNELQNPVGSAELTTTYSR